MLHKIINNLVDIDTKQYLKPAVVRGEEAVHFIIPYARTSAYKYSFFPAAVRLWYNIPAPMTIVSLSNLRLSLATIQLDQLLLLSMFLSMLHDASSFITV